MNLAKNFSPNMLFQIQKSKNCESQGTEEMSQEDKSVQSEKSLLEDYGANNVTNGVSG